MKLTFQFIMVLVVSAGFSKLYAQKQGKALIDYKKLRGNCCHL